MLDTFEFVAVLCQTLFYLAPLIISLALTIALLGIWIGRMEHWPKRDAIYFAFITATTVGYGDIRPCKTLSRILAICCAFIGIILTGIVVALALHSVEVAFAIKDK